MTITSYEKIEDRLQQNGMRAIAFRYVFHTGEEITRRFMVPGSYDDAAGIVAVKPEVEQQMIDLEDEELLASAEKGDMDPATVIPVHPETDTANARQKRWLRKLVRWAMENSDIKWVRKVLYPVWYEFKFNQSYTPAQVQGILDITPAQYNKFNDRLTAFHNSISMIDNDDAYVEVID